MCKKAMEKGEGTEMAQQVKVFAAQPEDGLSVTQILKGDS